MAVVCKKVPKSELVEKAGYLGVTEFITVQRTERPKDFPISAKWCMEPCFLPSYYKSMAEEIENFEVRPDDVWVITYPKCGTTWTQEMVWMICNDLDYEGAKESITTRFPYIEVSCLFSPDVPNLDQIAILKKMPSPRFIKSHLPAHLLPPQIWTVKPKIVYVARNVKDTAISWYHHYLHMQHYKYSFEDFMNAVLNDMVNFSPYHSHIIDFWNMRDEDNIIFLTYEDMKANHPSVIEKTAKFFGKKFTKEEVDTLADHLSFAKFSKNSAVNLELLVKHIAVALNANVVDPNFTIARKGVVGSHRDEMTPELIDRFNKWTDSEMIKWKCDPELRNIFKL